MDTPTPAPRHEARPVPGTARPARLWARLGPEVWLFLELCALTGFVVAQPLLDVFGRSPDFFLFRDADARDIVLFAIAVILLPPLALWAVELAAGLLGRPVRRVVHLALVAGLLGLLGLEIAKKLTPLRGPALAVVGVLAALGGGLLYARASAARMWLRFLWPAPLVFLLVFLLVSPTSNLLRPTPSAIEVSGAPQTGKPGPVVIVLMDEFPLMSLLDQRGQIDRRLYPNFARLAGGSTWYRNATAVTGMTGWAVPSILTGRYPAEDLLPIASQYPNNLFRLLADSYDYKLRVFEGMSQLCPPETCPDAKRVGVQGSVRPGQDAATSGGLRRTLRDSAGVWAQMVSTRDSAIDPMATLEEDTVDLGGGSPSIGPSADDGTRRKVFNRYKRGVSFQRFLSSIRRPRDPDERAMYFVHVLMPHQPWKYLPSGRTYPEREIGEVKAKGGRWVSEPWPLQDLHHRHLLQVAHADQLIGDLVERLRASGLYDRSTLLVTADHGMAFAPGQSGRANVVAATAPPVLWVPLFIKRPGQRTAETSDANWEHVDLVPTVADLLGVKLPWPVDGVSWADPKARNRQRTEKWFFHRPGVRQAFPGPPNHRIALRGVTDRLLRPEDGYLGWFKFGPGADLVGRRTSELPVADGGGTARVLGLGEYRQVDPAGGTVPAHVGGQLVTTAPGIPARPTVVAAVNGVIGGVSGTFASGGSPPTWFSTMISDSLLRQGDNHLELFLLDPTGGQRRLRPLTLTG
jgi:hypothetical protein